MNTGLPENVIARLSSSASLEHPKSGVFPGAWTAILVYLDNAGIWNLRAENLNSWYLGQEVYVSVVNPEIDKTELPLPENTIYCGMLSSLQKGQAQRVNFSGAKSVAIHSRTVLIALFIIVLQEFKLSSGNLI
ncbi:hypothetical protein U1Q18_033729 [Sarracenia purpurea var. burkii]